MLEILFREIAAYAALLLEAVVVIIILAGAIETLCNIVRYRFAIARQDGERRRMWMGFARWLILALEFALAADIVRTAIAPTWTEIGHLAAIAAIRTGLGFFLERDVESLWPRDGAV